MFIKILKGDYPMSVCMLCNGLTSIEKNCPQCGAIMVDAGLIQDYYDNYSAYLGQDVYEDGYRCHGGFCCVHLFTCPRCHYDVSLGFKRVEKEKLMN